MNQKVIAVTVNLNNETIKDENVVENKILELENLINATKDEVLLNIRQNKEKIDKAYYIGKGKALEIKDYVKKLNADLVVFNNELTASQVKNLESLMDTKVIDRTNLILDIFNTRARTKEAKLQVKLAKLKYNLPRLSMIRSGFSRQQGGIGTKGLGEQQIELDRRNIKTEIAAITTKLKEIEKNRNEIRKKRVNSKNKIISLIGYTNSGKSTLINKLISYDKDENIQTKEVFVKDMLFATLDTYVREGNLLNGLSVMYVDTVGFVSDIPHHLVESFKSTLEEIKYADILLNVVDISNVNIDKEMDVTRKMLKELNVENKEIIYVFNKMDKVFNENVKLEYSDIKNKVFISAKNDGDIKILLEEIQKVLLSDSIDKKLFIPYDNQNVVNKILKDYVPKSIEYTEKGTIIDISLKKEDYNIYKGYSIYE